MSNLWNNGRESRQRELRHHGYEKIVGIKAVSGACDTVPGQYLGGGVYVYRDVLLPNNRIATVYRRLDAANKLQDLRLQVPPGVPGEYCNEEDAILKKMQTSKTKSKTIKAGQATARDEETPRHPFASQLKRLNYWGGHHAEFEALGYSDGASGLTRLLLLCQQAVTAYKWDDGMKRIEIDTPNVQRATLLWWVQDGFTTDLRVVQPGQDAGALRENLLKLEHRGTQTQIGKSARPLRQQGIVTAMDPDAAQHIARRHGDALGEIVGGAGMRSSARLVSSLCDGLRDDADRCIGLGDGITHFIIPPQPDGIATDAHVLRWVRAGRVTMLLPFAAGELDKARTAMQQFIVDSEAKRAGCYWKKYRAEFEALGFGKKSSELPRILRLCQEAALVHTWDDGMNQVEIDTPNGQRATLLWRVQGPSLIDLRVVQPGQDAGALREQLLK